MNTMVNTSFPSDSVVKKLPVIAATGNTGSIPGLGDPLEKGMATHSSILAWKIPCTEEPGRLQSMGSQRVRQNQNDLAHKHQENTYKRRTKKGIKACHYKKKKHKGRHLTGKKGKNNYTIYKTISMMAIINPFFPISTLNINGLNS